MAATENSGKKFADFLYINRIRRKDMADYLGVSINFVTQICTGRSRLPQNHLEKILANSGEWDTTPLTNEDFDVSERLVQQRETPAEERRTGEADFYIERIKELQEEIRKLEKRTAEYWDLIKRLTEK